MHYRNSNNIYQYSNNDQRFIGPLIPFVGGALIGYIAGRPNYNNMPIYYPVYYPSPYYTYNYNYPIN